jgi:hypothetical protein
MTTYATGNPIGSTAAKDLYDNAENLDFYSLGPLDYYPDRLNVNRISLRGIENRANTALANTGFVDIGDYDADGPLTLTLRNQVFTKDGQFYSPSAALVLPYTTVNNWTTDAPNFVNRGDFVLRQDLGQPTGATLIGAVDEDGNTTTVQLELLKNKSEFLIVDSIAAARLVPASFKGIIATTGYYAGSADGGAMYRIDLSDTTSADNSFTTLVSTGGVRRKIVYEDKLTVKQAGAKGDYTKVSNTGTDDAIALQRAHDLTPRGVTVFYPLGLYYTSVTIFWNGGSNVEFQSRATSTDEAKCAIVGELTLDGVVHAQVGDTTFSGQYKNVVITRKTGTWTSSVRGLICSGVDQQVFEDCAVYRHGIGVHVNGQLNPWFSRLNTWMCTGYHVKISQCVEPRFNNCRFGRNGGVDVISDGYVLVDGAGGIQVDTVDFTACQFNQSGALANMVMRVINYNNPNGIFTFTSCHMEGWGTYVLGIDATTPRLQRVKFIGCTITSDSASQFIGGLGAALEDLQITGCTIAATMTFDHVHTASMNSSHLLGNLIINRGDTITTSNRIIGNVTLTGGDGKLTLMCNQISGTVNDTFTGTRSISGNI